MRRSALIALAAALACLAGAAPAAAQFGFDDFEVRFEAADGSPELRAGAHPFAFTTAFSVNTVEDEAGRPLPEGETKDLTLFQLPGLAGDPRAIPACSGAEFIDRVEGAPQCPDASAVGFAAIRGGFSAPEPGDTGFLHVPVYNLTPPPGAAAKLGFVFLNVPVTIEVGVNQKPPHNIVARLTNIPQTLLFYSSKVTLWGSPADPAHDTLRGSCLDYTAPPGEEPTSRGSCPVAAPQRPFLTTPRSCRGELVTRLEASSWEAPQAPPVKAAATTAAMGGCEALDLSASAEAAPTSEAASSPTGLEFALSVKDPGLTNPNPQARAGSDIKATEVTLPAGMTINPSQAEGLGVCSEAQLAKESAASPFGAGCPAAAKIGTVEVQTPLLEGEILNGSLFVAEPYNNRFGSLLALYMTIKSPKLGISINLAGRVDPDPATGQLITTFGGPGTDPLPEVPISEVRLRLREGARSPLITPPGCGTFEVKTLLTPWADPENPLPANSTFQISGGVGGGPCPPPGPPPHEPGFEAGTLSNSAGSHSPVAMRIARRDGDQDITRFDATLPQGLVAKLAGVSHCPEAQIAAIATKSGLQERAAPSCPANSRIGSVWAGAGVGSQLTYVPGSVYLAGPFAGAPLSVIGVVPAVAGPFDVGVVSTRQALTLDPVTAEVKVDGARSEPIPHILAGIPLKVRDIRVDVDRPQFTLNPTSCDPMALTATLWGAHLNLFSPSAPTAQIPAQRSSRFQAASCASLGFKPRLGIQLRGGVRRGAHPALRAIVTPRPGDANFSRAVVTLPRSAFLDQAHIRTICTRVQFAAGAGHGAACPPGARYGAARAWSPLLDEPLRGPVYLRASDNNLPDLVVALKGPASAPVDVELSARIDSVRGGIRSTFASIPDVPVSRFILEMRGGKRGLIVNSRHLCHKPARNRARSNIRGQNGRFSRTSPRLVATTCQQRRKAKR